MMIIKIGGGKDINISGIARDLSEMDEKVVIVHGANHFRDKLATELGKEKKVLTSVSGYSSVFSDEDALDIIMMAYSGLRNKRIVETLQLQGINALGLSGIDGSLIKGRRNRGIRIRKNNKVKIVRDLSGKPYRINTDLLDMLLDKGYVPVICIPIMDEKGYAINSENDDIVRVLKEALSADTIINLIEEKGFLDDKDDPGSIVKKILKSDLVSREEQVKGRMKRKMLALRKLFDEGECRVLISDGRTQTPIKDALDGKGTIVE